MKQFITDILHPFKAFERNYHEKLENFLDKYKKKYDERTIEESIVCQAFFHINFASKNDMRYYGALEAILVLNEYLNPGEEGVFKNEGYKNLIIRLSEQYLKDKNIL